MLQEGASSEYGARELKRIIHRKLAQSLAALVARDQIPAVAVYSPSRAANGDGLTIRPLGRKAPQTPVQLTVLLVDDNPVLLHFLGRVRSEAWLAFPDCRIGLKRAAWLPRIRPTPS